MPSKWMVNDDDLPDLIYRSPLFGLVFRLVSGYVRFICTYVSKPVCMKFGFGGMAAAGIYYFCCLKDLGLGHTGHWRGEKVMTAKDTSR